MPFPTKLPAGDPVKYLSQAPGEGAEMESMDDPAYKDVHSLVVKYGKDAVQAALERCTEDEAAEEGAAAPSDKAEEISETV